MSRLIPRSICSNNGYRAAYILLLLLSFLCSSCATPTVRQVELGTSVQPVVAAGGALSKVSGDRLVEKRLGPQQDDEHVRELIDTFREQAETPLVAGNHVSLLIDGPQTLAAIRRAIESAQHHVHVETYIFADDEVGREIGRAHV